MGTQDPLKELEAVQRRMNSLFEDALTRTNFSQDEGFDGWRPTSDLRESPTHIDIEIEIPGMHQDQIQVSLDRDQLQVIGERKVDRSGNAEQFHRVERANGRFMRQFTLPADADREAIDATYEAGVLRIRVGRKGQSSGASVPVKIR